MAVGQRCHAMALGAMAGEEGQAAIMMAAAASSMKLKK
jgi:hypothetical protein